ncbi:uncharacterized protein LOC144361204 [Saccoglossus kowalevskii]
MWEMVTNIVDIMMSDEEDGEEDLKEMFIVGSPTYRSWQIVHCNLYIWCVVGMVSSLCISYYFTNQFSPSDASGQMPEITRGCIMSLKAKIDSGALFLPDLPEDELMLPACSMGATTRKEPVHHIETVIPNIAHFVWFGNNSMLFDFNRYISILSVYKKMKPDVIMIHTDSTPAGKYWEEARRVISTLKVVYRERPRNVFGRNVTFANILHEADVARLEILLEYGGVYFDTDVIVVRSLEPLRHYDMVMGHEGKRKPDQINNGVILAKNGSQFLNALHRAYEFYNSSCFSCDSMRFPCALAFQFPNLIRVEKDNFHQTDVHATFEGHFKWQDHYTVQTFKRSSRLSGATKEKIRMFDHDNIIREDSAYVFGVELKPHQQEEYTFALD